MKEAVRAHLEHAGHQVIDVGTDSPEPVDYPEIVQALCEAIRRGEAELGIVLCGSGVGVCIAANKMRGIRAALCHDTFSARNAREDDDANVLCMGGRVIGAGLAADVTDRFVQCTFSEEARHRRRVDKVLAMEAAMCSQSV